MLFQGPLGLPVSAPLGVVAGGGSWQPTLPMPIVARPAALLPGYVDRYRKS